MTTDQKQPGVGMTVDGHVCVISLDNTAKKNAITPELMDQLSKHLTTFENDDSLWAAIVDPAGEHTTAGLDRVRRAMSRYLLNAEFSAAWLRHCAAAAEGSAG